MKELKTAPGHQAIMPYLILKGATGFMDFMKKTFGAEVAMTVPSPEGGIMHGEMTISGSTVMFADSTEAFAPSPAGMFIYVTDCDKTYEAAMAAGATSILPPADKEYGRAAGVLDAWGNTWWVTGLLG